MKPVQQPHPPIWYRVKTPEATVWAAANDANVVTLVRAKMARSITDRFRVEWKSLGKPISELPLFRYGPTHSPGTERAGRETNRRSGPIDPGEDILNFSGISMAFHLDLGLSRLNSTNCKMSVEPLPARVKGLELTLRANWKHRGLITFL